MESCVGQVISACAENQHREYSMILIIRSEDQMALKLKVVFLIVACIFSGGCASLGTSARLINPELIQQTDSLSIELWPSRVIPLVDRIDEKFPELIDWMLVLKPGFREFSDHISKATDAHLFDKLVETGRFSVVPAESLGTLLALKLGGFTRFDKIRWQDHQEFSDAQFVMLPRVSFGREAGGINSYVTLIIFQKGSADTVLETSFNTKWGKSYMFEKGYETTLPDAIEGAVNGLVSCLDLMEKRRTQDANQNE